MIPVLAVPATAAVNRWDCEAVSEVSDGDTEIVTDEIVTGGTRLTAAVADLLGSVTLWAVTVTVWDVSTLDGAAYTPTDEIVPIEG